MRALFLPVSLLLIVSAVFVVPLPFYVERPGASLDLAECLLVHDPTAESINGNLLMTFATYRRAALADVAASFVSDEVLLRPIDRVIPQDREPRQHFALQRERFDDAGITAAAVGLERARYPEPVRITGDGARVIRTVEGMPAHGVLLPDDVIVSVDGMPIGTAEELQDAIVDRGPLVFRVLRSGHVEDVTIVPARSSVIRAPRAVIGVHVETVNRQVTLPVRVDINAGRIGGPSAGLMVALGVYDAVNGGDLVGGRRIAGTGEINIEGEVGPIGALPLKVLAAHKQGASVFLVPQSQAEPALAALPAGSDLQVIGVSTIDDAITALSNLPPAEGELTPVRFRACRARAPADAGGTGFGTPL